MIKNKYLIPTLILMILALGFWLGMPNRTSKIGYVETNVLLSQFIEAQNAQKEFIKFQEGFDKQLRTYQDSIKQLVQFMRKNEVQAYQLNDSLQKLQDRYEKFQNMVYKNSKKKEEDLMQPVLSKANVFINEWGQKKGYSMIFGTLQGGNILYADTSLNLTQQILADLNKNYQRLPQK